MPSRGTIADLSRKRTSPPLSREELRVADDVAARELATATLSIREYVRAHAELLGKLIHTPEGRERVRAAAEVAGSFVSRAPGAERIRAGTMEKYSPRKRGISKP